MLFSIVVPVYNVEKYLDECIQSILDQVNTINNDCEILLIDDGSTDQSGNICDTYVEKFPNMIKVFHKENQGLLATRRYGFERSSGEYIINCDSDDLLENGMLKSVNEMIDKYQSPDVIIFNYLRYDGIKKSKAYENIFSYEKDCAVSKDDVLREYMKGHSIVSVWGKVVRRSCINIDMDYSSFGRLSTGEDTLQSVEFFSRAKSYVYLNQALYDYRCDSGMTGKFDANYYFTFKRIFEEIKKQKDDWCLSDFDELFAVKVLQTAGRAITQSRYKKWKAFKDQREYLLSIYNDATLEENYSYIHKVKNQLQRDHYILLMLLMKKHIYVIALLLRLKNVL